MPVTTMIATQLLPPSLFGFQGQPVSDVDGPLSAVFHSSYTDLLLSAFARRHQIPCIRAIAKSSVAPPSAADVALEGDSIRRSRSCPDLCECPTCKPVKAAPAWYVAALIASSLPPVAHLFGPQVQGANALFFWLHENSGISVCAHASRSARGASVG